MSTVQIRLANLDTEEFAALIEAHKSLMLEHSPPESSHALLIDGLKDPAITIWEMRDGGDLVGCGALKRLQSGEGEIKSMHTVAKRRGQGLGQTMLDHIVAEAQKLSLERLSLETGSMEGFLPARKLYEANGFSYCGPFGDYVEDPNSVFMTRRLDAPASA
ncbi:MAG: GNAT family N-acetyltransferase [Pseudomonadota bacterium]